MDPRVKSHFDHNYDVRWVDYDILKYIFIYSLSKIYDRKIQKQKQKRSRGLHTQHRQGVFVLA